MSDLTRAEAIEELKEMRTDAWTDTRQMKALEMAINSLKIDEMYDLTMENADEFISKSVIDDIKTEIDSHCSDNRDRNDGLYIAMKIIDKHIGKESK